MYGKAFKENLSCPIHCKEAGLADCMKDDCKKVIELVDRTLEQIQAMSPTDSL
jgi:hypothetical protein